MPNTYPPMSDSKFKFLKSREWDRAQDFYLKKPQAMAGQQLIERQSSKPSKNKSHGKNKNKVWPKIPSEEKPRERVLPNPIPES